MRIGVSSYSFASSISSGQLDLPGAVDAAADLGAAHLEIAAAELVDDPALVEAVRSRAEARSLPLASYVVGADLRGEDAEEQIERLTAHLGVAEALGIPRIRHDVLPWAWREETPEEFEIALERIVPAAREVCDRAAAKGITTTVENHGMGINDPERLIRLITLVDRPTFRATLDVGNFLCVAADPILSVRRLLPFAEVVHLKDFRIREHSPGPGWLGTLGDRAILGTVVGWGDLPLSTIVHDVVASGFEGPVSIEFEGPEDDQFAVGEGLRQAHALVEGVAA